MPTRKRNNPPARRNDPPKKSAGARAEKGKGYQGKPKPAAKKASPKPKPKPKPKGPGMPSLEDYLGADPYYQEGLSDLMFNMDQFGIQNDAAEFDIQSLFDLTMERMAKERERSLVDITDDFGARGLVNSGLYGKGVSDYNEQYADKVFDLNRDREIQLRNLGFEESNFEGLNDSKQNELRLDAIRRRAEEVGSRVGSGMGSAFNPNPPKKKAPAKKAPAKKSPGMNPVGPFGVTLPGYKSKPKAKAQPKPRPKIAVRHGSWTPPRSSFSKYSR